METLFKISDKLPKHLVFLISIVLVVFVGLIDRFTGYEISFSIFYLIPISFAAWFGNYKLGLLISLTSAISWLIADLSSGNSYSSEWIPYWNAFMRMGIFIAMSNLLSTLKNTLAREQILSRNDTLTGLYNRRAFQDLAAEEIERSVRYKHDFSIAYIDLDNFKQVNDQFGHHIGDELLKTVANNLRNGIRSADIAARLGGDEFALLLLEIDTKETETVLRQLQQSLLELCKQHNWPVTYSIGALLCDRPDSLANILQHADHLMYSVKRSGKNNIVVKKLSAI